MINFISPLLFLLIVSGCTTMESSTLAGEKSEQSRLGNALISPLSDLNIVKTDIPQVIQESLKDPYQLPDDTSCDALTEQIKELDLALGADFDALVLPGTKTVIQKGYELIGNEAIGSVERTINSTIPFRGWIRKLTGAERHSNQINAAIAAGTVRRAFLKGIGQEHDCASPAAPLRLPRSVVFVAEGVQPLYPDTILGSDEIGGDSTKLKALN